MKKNEKIKVLIVDDSPTARQLLKFIIESDAKMEVIGFAEDGKQAIEMLKSTNPDVVTMDIIMPKLDGFEATREIMSVSPIPIIIISSIYSRGDVQKSFKAMEAGALAILEKPKGINDPAFKDNKKVILETIRIMAEIKPVTRRKNLVKQSEPKVQELKPTTALPSAKLPQVQSRKILAVAIGTSLGGPQTLATLLADLPPTFPAPIFIVQHIAPGFIVGFAEWLRNCTKLKVKIGEHKEIAIAGTVYLAPDKFHMEVNKECRIILNDDPSDNGLKPSIGKLFKSVGESFGSLAVGIILTGMGRDGVDELLYMKQKGSETIAQDKDSSIIFGMPGEAIKVGAANHVVSLDQLASFLNRLVL
jgi:two-component system chemotaxis response regulator CheB